MRWVAPLLAAVLASCGGRPGAAPAPAPAAAPAARLPEPNTPPAGFVRATVLEVVVVGENHAVLLADPSGERILPIFIGPAEALAIDLRLRGEPFERPLTHDLLDSIVRELGARVLKVHVDTLRGGTFMGSVFLVAGDKVLEIDSRPSDAIAVALGNKAPIYVARQVFDEAGIPRSELDRMRGE